MIFGITRAKADKLKVLLMLLVFVHVRARCLCPCLCDYMISTRTCIPIQVHVAVFVCSNVHKYAGFKAHLQRCHAYTHTPSLCASCHIRVFFGGKELSVELNMLSYSSRVHMLFPISASPHKYIYIIYESKYIYHIHIYVLMY